MDANWINRTGGGEGEGLEHSRLADTHGIRARWESESEQMGGRGRIRHRADGWERHDGAVEPPVPGTADLPFFPGSLSGGKGRNQTVLGMKVEELNTPRHRRRLAPYRICIHVAGYSPSVAYTIWETDNMNERTQLLLLDMSVTGISLQ